MPPATSVAPYGTWRSPVSAGSLVDEAVAIMEVQAHAGRAVWNERRPAEAGRYVIVDETGGELLPAGFSARTQVHEYGGRCWTFVPGTDDLISSNWEDQRLWRFRPGAEPEPLTAEPPAPRAVRFADPVATPDGRWLICVRERHTSAPHRVDNDLVALPLLATPAEPRILAEGHDFYVAPAVSPDGTRLAWVTWDHPQMPWDATELWVADLVDGVVTGAERVAGDNGESVQQPRWSPDGQLHWVSDRTGWWNLYRDGEGSGTPPRERAEGSGTPRSA
jgi:dipeptidyl aminopeptidase/acylaminoacyl peptidase